MDKNDWIFLGLLFVSMCFGATLGGIIVAELVVTEPERVYFYEGDPEWIAVHNIVKQNDLLEQKIDLLQAHYDSMKCTSW